jgi:branched-subunit amino acid permease
MDSIRGYPAVIGFLVLAVILAILAVLYAAGSLQLLASTTGHHYKHALVLGVLALLSVVAASFARPRTA